MNRLVAAHLCAHALKSDLALELLVDVTNNVILRCIRESVDSLCGDGTDTPCSVIQTEASTNLLRTNLSAFIGTQPSYSGVLQLTVSCTRGYTLTVI